MHKLVISVAHSSPHRPPPWPVIKPHVRNTLKNMSSPFKSSLRAGGTKRCPGASGALPAEKTACSLESIAAGPVKKKPRWSAAEKRARKVAAPRACAYCSATNVRCRGDLADPDQHTIASTTGLPGSSWKSAAAAQPLVANVELVLRLATRRATQTQRAALCSYSATACWLCCSNTWRA